MLNILVTGGAGYIGSILVPSLLHWGHKVTVIDSFMFHQNSLAAHFLNPNLIVENRDVRDFNFIKKYISKSDIIIPLAAIVGAPACDKNPHEATSINKDAIKRLIEFTSNSQWVIMPTTNSAYGQSPGDTYLDEKSKLNPLSHYARDKVDIENILFEKNNFTSFRLATVFGMSPRMRLDLLVNYMVKAAIDPGYVVLFEHKARRNYIHVKDVAKVFNYAITNHDLFINQVFNVGLSEANLSKYELAERIKIQKKDFVITLSDYNSDPDKRDYLISNSKLEATGFKCDVSLEMGIEELLSGIRTLSISNYTNV